jgi:hypothetical protein
MRSTVEVRTMRAAIAFLVGWTMLSSVPVFSQPAIPQALEPWREWVLFGQEFLACPILNGRDARAESSHVCAWPGVLTVDVDAAGAEFEQRWTLYKDEWIPLPGNARYWPNPLSVDGTPQAAVLRGGTPMVRAAAGEHRVTGVLRFETRPASIPVPKKTLD